MSESDEDMGTARGGKRAKAPKAAASKAVKATAATPVKGAHVADSAATQVL